MEVVIDANILFSILIKTGKAEEILFDDDLTVYAPEFIFEEFSKYKKVVIEKTKRAEDYNRFLKIVFKYIKIISMEEY